MKPIEEPDHQLPQVEPQTALPSSAGQDPSGGNNPTPTDPAIPSPPSLQSSQSQQPQNDAQDLTSSQLVADDVDLIEKAWVEKAKAIVNKTQGDPHAQNLELNKMRAEYIKKRYNRDIKVSE